MRTKTFLDVRAAAEAAGLSMRHFRRIIQERQIPAIEIRGKFFILSRDLDNWKAKRSGTFPRCRVSPLH